MSNNIEIVKNLEPKSVFEYFARISDIPRGSGNTNKISEYLVSFAINNRFKYLKDNYNNVIVIKESKNKSKSPIALQAHIDMVCVKSDDNKKDMTKEGIEFILDGNILRANGTSLGADDGIGVAIILAILSDNKDYERDIVGIFTNDEEIGLVGANKIDLSEISVNKLINLDTEEFGVAVAGCAGGTHIEYAKYLSRINIDESVVFNIILEGGFGGHSAKEVINNRANANIEISKILASLFEKVKFNLVSIDGGLFDNAIPGECRAVIVLKREYKEEAIIQLKDFANVIKEKFKEKDRDLKLAYDFVEKDDIAAISLDDTKSILECLTCLPNGLIAINEDYPEIPKTSLNLGIVKTLENNINFSYLTRSNVNSEKEKLNNEIDNVAIKYKFKRVRSSSYPAWEYRKTELENVLVEEYKQLFGDDIKIKLTHGGLECGILLEKLNNVEAISIGPTAKGIHSIEEKLEVNTVKRCYDFLNKLLDKLS